MRIKKNLALTTAFIEKVGFSFNTMSTILQCENLVPQFAVHA